MADLKTFLHGLPAFERFSDRQLDALIAQLRIETHAPETVLLRQHEQGQALYLVLSGAIRVTYQDASGNEASDVHEARVGEIIGRLSLIPNLPSPVTCTAAEEIIVARLAPEQYHALFLLAPAVAHQFQYMVAAQLAHYLQIKNQALRQRLVRRPPTSLLERLFGV